MKKVFILLSVLFIVTGTCTGCGETGIGRGGPSGTSPDTQGKKPDIIDRANMLLKEMTLEEKVGQLFIVSPEELEVYHYGSGSETSFTGQMSKGLKKYHPGGIIMFGGNITDPEQLERYVSAFNENSPIPLFMSIDEEGGAVARLANNPSFNLPKYESAAEVGKGKREDAFDMGRTIGAYLRKYGFNLDFAPVADVFTNPENRVVSTRAFSSEAEKAAVMAFAMAEGLKSEGVIPTFKHFPGHGDTREDSHADIAVVNKTRQEIENCELLPFKKAGGSDLIMVGHLALPKICRDRTPATMSEKIVKRILREDLGFKGIIITDSLSMGAVSKNYSPSDAAIKAFSAGCDILLMPGDLNEAYSGILRAVRKGEIAEERLDESVCRILDYKVRYGIIK